MNEGMKSLLDHLETLVAFDTQNPPRDIHGDAPLIRYLGDVLGEQFEIVVIDHGNGSVTFHAVRGRPDILFNAHLDTVPALEASRFPPLELKLAEERAWGRGACDIKGAAACLLTVAQQTDAPLALLFTTDEEGGEGCCVAEFIASGCAADYRQIIVSEPTLCRAEFRHRGFLSARGAFTGTGGHSSEARALEDNAIHALSCWSAAALALATRRADAGARTCFNIGTVDGGVKSNVIADHARIFWSARLPPGDSNEEFLEEMLQLEGADRAEWTVSFSGPPLPTADNDQESARAFAREHGLDPGQGLDFWTEASLFGEAGIPALVFGPGSIEQAHVVDEWVSLAQLEKALNIYTRLVKGDG